MKFKQKVAQRLIRALIPRCVRQFCHSFCITLGLGQASHDLKAHNHLWIVPNIPHGGDHHRNRGGCLRSLRRVHLGQYRLPQQQQVSQARGYGLIHSLRIEKLDWEFFARTKVWDPSLSMQIRCSALEPQSGPLRAWCSMFPIRPDLWLPFPPAPCDRPFAMQPAVDAILASQFIRLLWPFIPSQNEEHNPCLSCNLSAKKQF